MNRGLGGIFVAIAAAGLAAAAAHATVVPADPAHVISLDGTWRFKLEQEGERPEDVKTPKPPAIVLPAHFEPFERTDYEEDGSWHDIAVPGNWEMSGYSPATYWQPDNAIGIYRLWFDVPADWRGRVVKLDFDGVQNGAEVYLNGSPVDVSEPAWGRKNYHEGGWDAFQADLTPQVKFGQKNLLAIRVYKNTRSADLDSGDYFFLGGVYRQVTLFSVPGTHVDDLTVRTTVSSDGTADVSVDLETGAGGGAASASMLLQDQAAIESHANPQGRIEFKQTVEHPRLWSAEHPHLYDLTVELKDGDGRSIERITRKIGIREVTIKNGVLLVNHVPVKLAGIARHDLYPSVGTAIDEAIWRKDLELMKAANINAVRTSHYPYGSKFYDLCDELGFYVADEMAACWCPTDTDELTPAFARHARELVTRDKNHASIIVWAIGNENAKGKNDRVAADQIRLLDPTRPRLVSRQDAEEAGVEMDDRHYTKPSVIAAANKASRRSVYPITYLENPNVWEARNGADFGSLDLWVNVMDRSWQEISKDEHVPGSFLWEWRDRAVGDPGPVRYYTYDPSAGIEYVKTKGICDAFGNPRADYYHVKRVYSPVAAEPAIVVDRSSATIDLTNRYSFTDLGELRVNWQLLNAGKALQSGDTRLSLAPLTQGRLRIVLPDEALGQADALKLDFDQPDGRNVVTFQFPIGVRPQPILAIDAAGLGAIRFPHLNLITVETNGWRWAHRHPTHLADIMLQRTGAASGEAPIDEAALLSIPLAEVREMNADIVFDDSPAKPVARVRVVLVDGSFSYRIDWSGPKADVQEIGWAFEMPKDCDHFSWNPKAYWSWYPSTHIGRPEGTATPDSANVSFAKITRPDAYDFNSSKYDCNWAELADASGHGLGVDFNADGREACRGDFGKDGSYRLVVNRYCCPPRDISSGVVPDLYYSTAPGVRIDGGFRVGTVGGL